MAPTTRADALRNRERLIDSALAAFAAGRPDEPLDAIARAAGVGIGTLYRHFPSREALVEAVYRSELERVCDAAPELLDAHPPVAALRAWMGRYAQFVATKRGMAEALRAAIAAGAIQRSQTRERVTAAVASFLDAGARTGELRADVDAEDVTASLVGVMLGAHSAAQADRMLDLLVDGLRQH